MNKIAIAIFAIMAIVAARPSYDEPIPIIRQSSDIAPDGSFQNSFETENGISFSESGYLKNVGDDQAIVVEGSYGFTSPEGQPIQLKYVADENGYRPESDSLPTPPPADPAILRSLEYLASLPSTEGPNY